MDISFISSIKALVADIDLSRVKTGLQSACDSSVKLSTQVLVFIWSLPMEVKIEKFIVERHENGRKLLVLEADSKLNKYRSILPKRRSEYEVNEEIERFLVNCGYRFSHEYLLQGTEYRILDAVVSLYKLKKLETRHSVESAEDVSDSFNVLEFSAKSNRDGTAAACDSLIALVKKIQQDLPIVIEEGVEL